jgi:integrase
MGKGFDKMTRRRGWNEGTIYKMPNGCWRSQISVEGKRISKLTKTQKEASKWLLMVKTRNGNQIGETESEITLEKYLPEWLDIVRTSLRPNTAIQYGEIIHHHILPRIGQKQLRGLNLSFVDRFYAGLHAEGIGLRTIGLIHATLHVALERATRYGYLTKNPVHGAIVPKGRSPEMGVLDVEQVSRFLVAADGNPFEVLFHLAVVTGMRQGELFGLKWCDISWNQSMLIVRRQVQRVPGKGRVFSEPKTKAGLRKIGVGESTLDKLRLQHERQMGLKALAGNRWQENDLVFTSQIGTPLDNSNVLKEYYGVLGRAGLQKIRFHDLRHTAASLLLNNGQGILAVSKLLGHSKPSVTLDIYGHVYNESMEEVARVMESLVTPTKIELPEKVISKLQTISK